MPKREKDLQRSMPKKSMNNTEIYAQIQISSLLMVKS